MNKFMVLAITISLASFGIASADEFDLDEKELKSTEIKEVKEEEVKELRSAEDIDKAVERKVEAEAPAGITEGKLIQILGIASWAMILCAILTWWVLPVKKIGPKRRMLIHKIFGYAALAIATLHGLIAFF